MSGWATFAADVLISAALFIVAYKSRHRYYWLALIPVANLFLMCDLADVEWYYMFGLFFRGSASSSTYGSG